MHLKILACNICVTLCPIIITKRGEKKDWVFFCSSISLLYAEGYFLIKCSGEQDREIVSVLSSNKAQIERRIKKWEERKREWGEELCFGPSLAENNHLNQPCNHLPRLHYNKTEGKRERFLNQLPPLHFSPIDFQRKQLHNKPLREVI